LLFLSLAGACAAIITYTIFYFGGFDRPVAIGISAASAAIFIWNVFNLGRYWRYQLLRVSFSRALFSIVLVLIIGTTLALHTGIGPFSNAGDTTGVVTEPPGPTPTMAPVQLSGEDIGKTRQDGSLKVTLDGVYLLSKDILGVEISVENAGDSKLVETQFHLVPEAGSADNPFLRTAHPCYEGIPPGQICYCRLADSTYVEIYSRDLVMQTYLVVYSNDVSGESFGVTFTLPET
jgi:hypothetical protein